MAGVSVDTAISLPRADAQATTVMSFGDTSR